MKVINYVLSFVTFLIIVSVFSYALLDKALPWHPLQQIAKTSSDTTSIDQDANGRIDPGIIEDTLQDITNNGAETTNAITIGGLTVTGTSTFTGSATFNSDVILNSITNCQTDLITDANGKLTCSTQEDKDSTNELQNLAQVLSRGNDAQGQNIVNVGKLSIGTSTPTTQLDVKGDVSAQYLILKSKTTGVLPFYLKNAKSDESAFDDEFILSYGNAGDDRSKIFIGPNSQVGGKGEIEFDAKIFFFDNGKVGIGIHNPQDSLDVSGSVRISGRLGTNNFDPDSGYPSGWGGGIHTWDVYAEGTVGAGSGGSLNAYINRNGVVSGKTFCLNGDCRTSWSQIGGKLQCIGIKKNWRGREYINVYCPAGYVATGGSGDYDSDNKGPDIGSWVITNSQGVPIGWHCRQSAPDNDYNIWCSVVCCKIV